MKPKDPSSNPSEQDPNEARVLAMLFGESDPEEQTALEALLAEDADLRAYRDRTARRLGLMGEAAQGKAALEAEPLQLDAERRTELQALLAGEEDGRSKSEKEPIPLKPEEEKTQFGFLYLAAAAAVAFAIIINWPNQADENITEIASGQGARPDNDSQTKEAHAQDATSGNGSEKESLSSFANKNANRQRAVQDSDKDSSKRFSAFKTKAISEISKAELASSDKTNGNSPVPLDDTKELDDALNLAVTETTNEILDQRLADEIAAINDPGQAKLAPFSKQSEPEALIVDGMTTDGFAFAGRVSGGGFVPIEEGNLNARDSSTASSGPTPPVSAPAPSKPIIRSIFFESPPPSPAEPGPEAEVADLAPASTRNPSPNDASFSLGVGKSASLKKDDKLAKDNGVESDEKSREIRRADVPREDKLDRDNALASNVGSNSRKNHPAGERQELASNEKNEEGISRLRSKPSEEAKKAPQDAPLDPSAATGKLEENLSLEGFVDSSYTEEGKRGKEQGKGRKEPARLHDDLATAPPPLPIQPNPERIVAEQPLSSFNLKPSDASFGLAHASIQKGQWPARTTIRSEEFVNAFDYGDPMPEKDELLSFHMERAHHPFANDRQVLRLSISAAPVENQKARPLNLVIALDNSSSMKREDRLEMAQKALHGLAQRLTSDDRVSLVTFAGKPKLRLNHLPGDQLKNAISEISQLGSEEETNLGLGLDISYAVAQGRFLPKGNNRVLLLSDGGVNFWEKDPRVLKAKGDEIGNRGITLDCIGLGAEGYQDHVLETISRKGRYFFINKLEDVDDALARKITNSLRPAFTNLKVQIAFEPERVEIYRQVGFERAQLRKQYFDGKSIGGSEIANGETSNALYVVKVNPKGKGNLGVLRLRFKDMRTGNLQQLEWPLPYESEIPAFVDASDSMRLAVHAATFAEWLAENPYSAGYRIEQAIGDLQSIRKDFPEKASIDRLSEMMIRSRSISR